MSNPSATPIRSAAAALPPVAALVADSWPAPTTAYPHSGSGTAPLVTPTTKNLLPWLVAVSFFMESLDITILNTAVPTISRALEVAPLSLKSALTAYALSLALFIPLSGWLADRFGTRRVFASAIGVFTFGSLLCGLAPNLPALVAARILQGAGGALMMPVGRIAIVRTFEKAEIVRAMSFVVIPGLIGPLVGPLAGGLIVAYFHWRTIFLVNLPIGLLGLWAVRRFMPDFRSPRPAPFDLRGFALFGGGVALLSYVLEVFGKHSLPRPPATALLVAALALLFGYMRHARRHAHPLLDPALFRIRTFRVSVGGGFFSRLGIGGMPFLLPLYYQVGLGYPPVRAALLIMPQTLAAMTTKAVISRLLGRYGYRWILRYNTLFIGTMLALFATVTAATPVWLIVTQAFVYGLLTSLQFTSVNTLQFADLKPAETSMGSSIGSIMQQLSLSFGVAIASLVTALFLGEADRHDAPALTTAIRHTFVIVGSITFASTLLFRELRPEDGRGISGQRDRTADAAEPAV
ncbi:MAG: MFS transporter [Opitutaceae bacterium]